MEKLTAGGHLDLYSQVLDHPYAPDDLRRMMESKLLRYRQALLFALPSPFVAAPSAATSEKAREQANEKANKSVQAKDKAREETETLAKGMALLKLPDELAWTIMFDWVDTGAPGKTRQTRYFTVWVSDLGSDNYGGLQLRQYIEIFQECVSDAVAILSS
jgi:hypothetical protein